MKTDQLTFNDLPAVVGELCDRIASMENLLTEETAVNLTLKTGNDGEDGRNDTFT